MTTNLPAPACTPTVGAMTAAPVVSYRLASRERDSGAAFSSNTAQG